MTPEQQRIAIAEALGYKNLHAFNSFQEGSFHRDGAIVGDIDGRTKAWVPDYLNDLNAMHEAEKALTDTQWDEYERLLRIVCEGCSYYEGAGKELIHATAAQRAEAFLRTLKLWKE